MPPFKQAYSFSALLSLTGLPVGVEVERLSASRTTEIGEVRASTFGALGEILLRIGGKPINFLLLAGYGLYNEKFSFTVGTETASIKEQSGGAKAGIYLQFFLGENLLLTGGGSYRKLPIFTEGKELNFSGFEFSAGIGLQL